MKKLFTLIALLATVVSGAWADEVVLSPTDATYINATASTTNYNEQTPYLIGLSGISNGALRSGNNYNGPVAIFKFNTSEALNGKTLISATLSWTATSRDVNANAQVAVALMSNTEWSASTATWENVTKTASQLGSAGWTNKGTTSNPPTNQTYTVSDQVRGDADGVIAFALYTLTARQHDITNVKLTITYSTTPVDTYDYTVNAIDENSNILKTIASGSCYSTDNKVVIAPYAVEKDGVWYVKKDAGFGTAITATNTYNVVYQANNDIVCYIEETTAGNNVNLSNGGTTAASGSNSGFTGGISIGNLTPGTYTAYMKLVSNGNRALGIRNKAINLSTNDIAWMPIDKNSNAGMYSVDFTLLETTLLSLTGYTTTNSDQSPKGTNQSADFDYFYIVKTGEATVPVTISGAGYATFVAPYAVDFTGNAIEAFYVSDVNSAEGTVTLTQVTEVPAGEAIIVKGESGNVNVIASAEAITNLMQVAINNVIYDENAEQINYVLAKPAGEAVGLYPVTSGTIAAGKGYLPVPKSVAVKGGFTFVTDDVTATNVVKAAPAAVKNGKFATADGIVIVKDGVKYNVAGMKK